MPTPSDGIGEPVPWDPTADDPLPPLDADALAEGLVAAEDSMVDDELAADEAPWADEASAAVDGAAASAVRAFSPQPLRASAARAAADRAGAGARNTPW